MSKRKQLTPEEEQRREERRLLKNYLSQYYMAKKGKMCLERRLHQVVAEIEAPIGGVGYSAMPRGTSVSAGSASIVMKIADIEDRIEEQKDTMAAAMLKVMDIMDYLPRISTERAILEMRHIDCLPWSEICEEVNLTRTPCNDYYNNGIKQLLQYKRVKKILEQYSQEKSFRRI